MENQNVLIYIDRDGNTCSGSEGVFITELKTRQGIINRIEKHMEYMANKGYDRYIIITYSNWRSHHSIEDIMDEIAEGRYQIYDI